MTAAASLLLPPIWVISDTVHENNYLTKIEPVGSISKEEWEEPIILVHYGEKHYDGTIFVQEFIDSLNKQQKVSAPIKEED